MLGTTFGYYDPENAYNIDVVVELFEDAITSVGKLMFWAGDEQSKQQEMQKHIDTIHKPALKFFESQLEDHLGPFISGEKLTIADFCLFAIKRNVWSNPMYAGVFDSIINEHECVQHYLKTIEKEVPMVPEEDGKGQIDDKVNQSQAELEEATEKARQLKEQGQQLQGQIAGQVAKEISYVINNDGLSKQVKQLEEKLQKMQAENEQLRQSAQQQEQQPEVNQEAFEGVM